MTYFLDGSLGCLPAYPPLLLSSPQCPVLAWGCQSQNGPLFCAPPILSAQGLPECRALSCCPAPTQCPALSLPPPLARLLINSRGWGRGPRQGLWYSSHVMELDVGALPFVPLPYACTCPSAYTPHGTAQACVTVTVRSSEELEVGAWSSTTPAPTSRVRLALETGLGVVIPKPPAF